MPARYFCWEEKPLSNSLQQTSGFVVVVVWVPPPHIVVGYIFQWSDYKLAVHG
jgi:hypothetical protein